LSVRLLPALLALALAGCTSTYSLTLMPRNSGKIYSGEAVSASGADTQVAITIEERVYKGNWVVTQPPPSTSFGIGGIFGGGGRGGVGVGMSTGNTVVVDQGEAKALLRAADGSGLRCDLRGANTGSGSGTCQDDRGLVYDVQIRYK
jgi:hypothetical protein